jgi:hypothetical protein
MPEGGHGIEKGGCAEFPGKLDRDHRGRIDDGQDDDPCARLAARWLGYWRIDHAGLAVAHGDGSNSPFHLR